MFFERVKQRFSKKELEEILEFVTGEGFSKSFAGTFEYMKSKDGYETLGGGDGKWRWLEGRKDQSFKYDKKDGSKGNILGSEILEYEKISDLHMDFFGIMCNAPDISALAEKFGGADSRLFVLEALKHY